MASTIPTPLLIYTPFGVGAANPTYINIPIPVPSQIGITVNAASFTDGFPPSTMTPEASGGLPFFGQDMNGILYMLSSYCASFAAGWFSSYNSTLAANASGYPAGAQLLNANSVGTWINVAGSGNTTDPDSGGAGWQPLAVVGQQTINTTGGTTTLSYTQAARPLIFITGALSSNAIVVFPVWTGENWVIVNSCTGSYTVTVKTTSQIGSGIVVPATNSNAPTSVYCDGTSIQNTGVSTAGLAPINSPTFTGTPAGPTASPATTNTSQLANTAFVQAAIAAALAAYAPKASPMLTGTPTAPTASPGTNTTQLATTAFVEAAVDNLGGVITNEGGQALVMQYGTCTNTGQTFPTAYPNACVTVSLTPYGGSGAGAIASFNRFGFTITGGGGNDFLWQAWGY